MSPASKTQSKTQQRLSKKTNQSQKASKSLSKRSNNLWRPTRKGSHFLFWLSTRRPKSSASEPLKFQAVQLSSWRSAMKTSGIWLASTLLKGSWRKKEFLSKSDVSCQTVPLKNGVLRNLKYDTLLDNFWVLRACHAPMEFFLYFTNGKQSVFRVKCSRLVKREQDKRAKRSDSLSNRCFEWVLA